MEIRLLGPLEVRLDDGSVVEPTAAKVRQLLALLALDPGRVRSVDSIVDTLWGDASPASAQNLVQGYVSDLRRLLGAAAVVRSGAGYRLDVPRDAVDLVRFERLLAELAPGA